MYITQETKEEEKQLKKTSSHAHEECMKTSDLYICV